MPSRHAWNIYHALKKTSLKAAKAYLDGADRREMLSPSSSNHVDLKSLEPAKEDTN